MSAGAAAISFSLFVACLGRDLDGRPCPCVDDDYICCNGECIVGGVCPGAETGGPDQALLEASGSSDTADISSSATGTSMASQGSAGNSTHASAMTEGNETGVATFTGATNEGVGSEADDACAQLGCGPETVCDATNTLCVCRDVATFPDLQGFCIDPCVNDPCHVNTGHGIGCRGISWETYECRCDGGFTPQSDCTACAAGMEEFQGVCRKKCTTDRCDVEEHAWCEEATLHHCEDYCWEASTCPEDLYCSGGRCVESDESPSYDGAGLDGMVTIPGKLHFRGWARDDHELNKLTILVTGPRGENLRVISIASIDATEHALESYFFDSADESYAGLPGLYYVAIWIKDYADQAAERVFMVDVTE